MSNSRYRDSGNGQFIDKQTAQNMPKNTWEKEAIKNNPPNSKGSNKK
jgi:hypothetical protein